MPISINEVTVLGNLTRDPEMKALPSGMNVTSFGLATSRKVKDEYVPEFHNIIAFSKAAEVISQYMKKGSEIMVKGRMQTRSWEKDGQKHYRTEIIVNEFQFGRKPESEAPKKVAGTDVDYPEEQVNPQDIPF
jgi:single-strand DNA-binding protein